jgi:hypothetical protein
VGPNFGRETSEMTVISLYISTSAMGAVLQVEDFSWT